VGVNVKVDINVNNYQLSFCQVYNNGLLINANCRTKDALEYIRKEFKEFSKNMGSMAYDETDRWLDCLFTGKGVIITHCLSICFLTRSAQYTISVIKRSSVRPSVCLSRRSTKAAAAGGFAAEVLLELNFIILNIVGNKNVNCRREAAPRSLAFK